jgi:hypothetical protein
LIQNISGEATYSVTSSTHGWEKMQDIASQLCQYPGLGCSAGFWRALFGFSYQISIITNLLCISCL